MNGEIYKILLKLIDSVASAVKRYLLNMASKYLLTIVATVPDWSYELSSL